MKKRIDVLLYEKGLAPSREKARTLIMAGCVYADNQKFDKPGDTVREDAVLEVRGNTLRYVSRGGLPYVWTSAHLRAVLRTACCKTAPPKYTA